MWDRTKLVFFKLRDKNFEIEISNFLDIAGDQFLKSENSCYFIFFHVGFAWNNKKLLQRRFARSKIDGRERHRKAIILTQLIKRNKILVIN